MIQIKQKQRDFKRGYALTAICWMLLATIFLLAGCEEHDPPIEDAAENVSESVEDAVDEAGDNLEDAGDEVQDAFN